MEGSPVYPADAVILARGDGFRHGCGPVAGFGPIRCSIGPSGQFTWHTFLPRWSRVRKILSRSSHSLVMWELFVMGYARVTGNPSPVTSEGWKSW